MSDAAGFGAGDYSEDLYFTKMICSYVDAPRFIRRQWWADEVTRQLAVPGCNYVVLIAEPGAGKTGLMAQLARDHPRWPRCFLRRDQQQPLADGSARAVLERVGFQLAAVKPELFLDESIELSVEQHVGAVPSGGQVVGAEVDRMVSSPFKRVALKISQDVSLSHGEVVGLRVREWISEMQLLPVSTLASIALISPLSQARDKGDLEQTVVLLDALDEAVEITGGESILDWLARAPALPANLHVVATARPGAAVDAFVERQGDRVRLLRFDPADVRVREELRRYADGLAEAEMVRFALRKVGRRPGDFSREAVSKADGNIGYLAALGRALDQAGGQGTNQGDLESLAFLRHLPEGLRGLYRFFLGQLKKQIGGQEIPARDREAGLLVPRKTWPWVYRPLLEVLSTSLDHLGIDELMALMPTLASRSDVTDALDHLTHLLDHSDGRYRFHHATIAEFLTAPQTAQDPATAGFAVDAAAVNRRIAHSLTRVIADFDPQSGQAVDSSLRRYALAFLPAHLIAALNAAGANSAVCVPLREELRSVLTDIGFVEAKVSEIGIQPMLADLVAAEPRLEGDADIVRRMYSLLTAEARNLQPRQQGDMQPLGKFHFGNRLGDLGRKEGDFEASWFARPGFTAQQVLNRALSAADSELAAAARAELEKKSLPRLELQWAASSSPPQIFDSGYLGWGVRDRVVAVSPNGRWVLTHTPRRNEYGSEPWLTVWDTLTGPPVRVKTTYAESVARWAVTADGRFAVAGIDAGIITVWDLQEAKCVGRLAGSGHSTTALAVAGSGDWIMAADDAGQVQVWDLAAPDAPPKSLERLLTSPVTSIAVLENDHGAVGVTQDGQVYLWELDGQPHLVIGRRWEERGIRCVAVSSNGQAAAYGSAKSVTVVDLDSHERRITLAAPGPAKADSRVTSLISLAFLPGDQALAGAFGHEYSYDNPEGDRVMIWDVGTGRLLADYSLEAGWSNTLLSTRAPRAFSSAGPNGLAGWRLELGQYALSPHGDAVTGVAIAERSPRAASVSRDGTLRTWHLGTGPSSRELGPNVYGAGCRSCVALTADGLRALCDSPTNGLREDVAMWELDTGDHQILVPPFELSYGYRPPVYWLEAVAVSADGCWGASVSSRTKEVVLWNLADMSVHARIKGAAERRLAATPDLHYAISDGPAWWDLRAERCSPLPTETSFWLREGIPVQGSPRAVTAVAITADGTRGAVGYENGTVRLWDLKHGPTDAGRLSAHAMGVQGLAFLSDRLLASASGDRTVAVWDTGTGAEVARAAFPAPLRCLAASGDRLLAGDAKGSLYYCHWHEPS